MEDSKEEILEAVVQQYEAAAAELERAARHLRTTADHIRDRGVTRGCAHVFAALGHLSKVDRQLRELAELHSTKAQV